MDRQPACAAYAEVVL